MTWDIDFYIEIADIEKDIYHINRAFQSKMKLLLIMEEYGIYDEEKDRWIGFRLSIPGRIKQMYDDICAETEELEKVIQEISA